MANAQVSSTSHFNPDDLVQIKSNPIYGAGVPSDSWYGKVCQEDLAGKIGRVKAPKNSNGTILVEVGYDLYYYEPRQLELIYES